MSGRLVLRVATVTLTLILARIISNGGADELDIVLLFVTFGCGAIGWYLERTENRDGR